MIARHLMQLTLGFSFHAGQVRVMTCETRNWAEFVDAKEIRVRNRAVIPVEKT